ncbi:hypothetical protein MMC20_002619 [Loxospora ochrophaea]|nr:hypothetical protein [Loxospora ochrophaea]
MLALSTLVISLLHVTSALVISGQLNGDARNHIIEARSTSSSNASSSIGSLNPTTFYFDLTPPSTNGEESTDHISNETFALSKRAMYAVMSCPPSQQVAANQFIQSLCEPRVSPQALVVFCRDLLQPQTLEFGRLCTGNKICVPDEHPVWHVPIATCVDPEDLDTDDLDSSDFDVPSKDSSQSTVNQPSPVRPFLKSFGVPGSGRGVTFLLTGPKPSTRATATNMQISAQSKRELFGAVSYTTLDDGLDACNDCATIGLHPIPAQAARIEFSILLPPGQVTKVYHIPTLY